MAKGRRGGTYQKIFGMLPNPSDPPIDMGDIQKALGAKGTYYQTMKQMVAAGHATGSSKRGWNKAVAGNVTLPTPKTKPFQKMPRSFTVDPDEVIDEMDEMTEGVKEPEDFIYDEDDFIAPEKLDFWVVNSLNVILVGKAGVGKTHLAKSAFDRNKLKWKYYSASTMDAWVDFVGVPEKHPGVKGGDPYLNLVRLPGLHDVEAFFFDEYNRAPKKVRNAVMELIQFKSINGERFKNLRMIWAAINPHGTDDEYDVEKLDKAQMDRFEVQVEIPYKPSVSYFVGKYGKDNARSAIQWWNELSADQKELVSPRRLDYALGIHKINGDLEDVLPISCNISKLRTNLKVGSVIDRLKAMVKGKDRKRAVAFLRKENYFNSAIKYIVQFPTLREFLLPLCPKEKIAVLLSESSKIVNEMDNPTPGVEEEKHMAKMISHYIIKQAVKEPAFDDVCTEVLLADQNRDLIRTIKALWATHNPDGLAAVMEAKEEQRKKLIGDVVAGSPVYDKDTGPTEAARLVASKEWEALVKQKRPNETPLCQHSFPTHHPGDEIIPLKLKNQAGLTHWYVGQYRWKANSMPITFVLRSDGSFCTISQFKNKTGEAEGRVPKA